jgi:TolB-like protein/DNA-binding winged helix-turn-helix (wHTH) protein/Flp pilus assembly protein TadD
LKVKLLLCDRKNRCYTAAPQKVPAALPTEVVKFDEFELDCNRYQLLRAGRRIKLEKLPMELLILLLEKEGHLVTREEIVDRLWGPDVFLDTEHGINTAIRKIRNALRDDPERPRFVQTVTGKGYRFLAPFNLIAQERGNGNYNGTFIGQVQPNTELSGRSSKKANDAGFTLPKIKKLSLSWIGIIGCLLLAWFAFSAGLHLFRHSDKPALVIRSIAVLPLENLSGDATQDYFADGMTEQLITQLGQVKVLRVISHTSVNQYKGTKKPVPVIARELQVDAVVEGTVTRSQGRVRVTANLVQATPERHLWAEAFDRDMRDALSLQAELSQAIARAVRVELTPKERESFANRPPTDLAAQEAYLKGLSHFVRGKDQLFVQNEGKQELHKANEYFQQAITIDPQYALGYAGLARSNIWLSILERPALDAARVASDRAISLEENLAEPHMVRGGVLLERDSDWTGAEREFLRSIELNSSYAEAHQGYGIFLSLRGRFDEATAEMDRAVMIDPVGRSAKTQAAWIDVCAGNYDKAITRLRNITELFPNDALSHEGLGIVYVLRRRVEEGIAELRRSGELWGKDPSRNPNLGWAYAISGKSDRALQILDKVKRESAHDADSEYQVALIYAGLGDNDQVFIWLDKAYRDRHSVLNEVWREPQLIPLRTDPRLRQLARRLGIIA